MQCSTNAGTQANKYETAPKREEEEFQQAILISLFSDVVPNSIDLQEVRVHRKC